VSEDAGVASIVIVNTGNTAVSAVVRYVISWCQICDYYFDHKL